MLRVPKWDEVTRKWRKLHSEELYVLYTSPKVNRIIKLKKNWMGGTCITYGR
jgi:hypothetical protein